MQIRLTAKEFSDKAKAIGPITANAQGNGELLLKLKGDKEVLAMLEFMQLLSNDITLTQD